MSHDLLDQPFDAEALSPTAVPIQTNVILFILVDTHPNKVNFTLNAVG